MNSSNITRQTYGCREKEDERGDKGYVSARDLLFSSAALRATLGVLGLEPMTVLLSHSTLPFIVEVELCWFCWGVVVVEVRVGY